MRSITQIQDYLRQIAEAQYQSKQIPFFTLFFHPSDSLKYFNYAIPNTQYIEEIGDTFKILRAEFLKRERTARLEFLEEYYPQLSVLLEANQFIEESRQFLMACTPNKFSPVSDLSKLKIKEINKGSEVSEAIKFINVQRTGFGGNETEKATDDEAHLFLQMLGNGKAFLGVLEGKVVSVGMITESHCGISELAGLATLEQFRRRGIATTITSKAVERAFDLGAEIVILTAADEKAGRIYQKVGFKNFTQILAFIDGSETNHLKE